MASGVAEVEAAIATAARLCVRFEGVYLRPYLCPAGVPTIGIGSTRYEDGRRVTLADPPVTRERAEQLLQWELRRVCLPAVLRSCPNITEWGPEATGAIVDFTFNLGAGALARSTLRRRIVEDNAAGARAELLRWVRARGRVLPGLVRRRVAEAELL